MRIIDLLNKIANKEELPQQIKIYDEKLRLNENKDNYLYEESDEYYGDELIHWFNLNTEVEIIEDKEIIKDKEIERLNNIIKTMEKYFELIIDLGYDYDGLNEEDSLKKLIDELCRYASLGRVYNTTEPVYVNENKKYNILHKELKGSDKQ